MAKTRAEQVMLEIAKIERQRALVNKAAISFAVREKLLRELDSQLAALSIGEPEASADVKKK